jgi:hypothetical protein
MKRVMIFVVFLSLVFATPAFAAELPYTYEVLTKDIMELQQIENTEVFSIGQSEYGRELYAVKLGKGELTAVILGTAHAREWINSALVSDMAKYYANAYNNYECVGNYYVRDVLDKCSIVFIPMQNPDGVALQQQGLSAFTPEQQAEIQSIGCSNKYKQWKANAKGVDLNRQQDINWDKVRMNEPYPSYHNHKGYSPEQAAEAKAVIDYILKTQPQALISYHSSGQVIDWTGCNADTQRDLALTKKVAATTGYRILYDDASQPAGGLSPWFRAVTGGMALTMETGRYNGENEVVQSEYPAIWNQNYLVGLITANEVYQNWYNSAEKDVKMAELNQKINNYRQEIHDTEKALDDIRQIKQIMNDDGINLIKDNKIIDVPVILENNTSYINYFDIEKVHEKSNEVSRLSDRLINNALIKDNQLFIPIQNFDRVYQIQWDVDSRTILLSTAKVSLFPLSDK